MKRAAASSAVLALCLSLTLLAGCQPDAEALDRVSQLLQEDQTEEAEALLERAAPEIHAAGDPDELLELARLYVRMEELPKGIKALTAGLASHPAHEGLARAAVEVYSNLGQYGHARDVLLLAREKGLGDEHVALSLGVCYGRLGALDEAQAEFARAREAGADLVQLNYNLALMKISEGEDREALELLAEIMETEEPPFSARREYARLLIKLHAPGTPELEQGLALAWECRDENEEDWRSHEALGEAYMKMGDYAAASQFFEDALRHGRNPARVEEKYIRAMKALKAEVEGDPADGE